MVNKKAKILVVDDEPEIVDTLKHFLSVKGYEVMGSFNGKEALNILEKEKMDLILLDVMMPGIKGTDVAKIIKEKYPSVKIIIVTGYPQEGENLSKDRQLDSVFIKPVRIEELYNKLSELLNPKDGAESNLELTQGIKARVLLIKAKLLFAESDLDIFNFLSNHFKDLSNKGESYETDVVTDEEKVMEKINSFNPGLLAVNVSFFKQANTDLLSKITGADISYKEIIIYNIKCLKDINTTELDRLTKAVETSSLKNGFIEVKWVEL
jgi:CheY-like chemotaxis protein